MKHYYSTVDSIVLTHSDMVTESNSRRVYVRFQRPNEKGIDFAEGVLPENTFIKTYGFSEDELLKLTAYLKDNALLIWDYAQKGGGLNFTDSVDSKGETGMTDEQYRSTIEMVYQILKADVEAGKTPEEILAAIVALKNDPTGEERTMQHTFRLSALDADVLIDGDTVAIMNSEGESVQVSAKEWETLREKWRFNDVVESKSGETPMTLYQFRICVELTRQIKKQEAEIKRLKANRLTSQPQTAQS